MVTRSTCTKYSTVYCGTSSVLSRQIGRFRLTDSGYFDKISSTIELPVPRIEYGAKSGRIQGESKYCSWANAGQMQGGSGACMVHDQGEYGAALDPSLVPLGVHGTFPR